MTYHMDLMREAATICLTMTLGGAETFVRDIDPTRLTPVEYIDVLGSAAGRIGGCAAFEPAGAAAAAARVAMRAISVYDRSSGDQTIVVTKLLTRYLRYGPADFREDAQVAGLTNMLTLWIEVWSHAEAAIDPTWRADEEFPAFDPGVPNDVTEGQTPESVRDPAVRALYAEHMARKAMFLRRTRDQSLLRRALDEARDDYVAYAAQLRNVPGMRGALSAAAAQVADPALKATLGR